ncbi:iron-sulfur cluster assembly 1-like protein, mitochondrial, partial [Catenaria anguillulae PL171]
TPRAVDRVKELAQQDSILRIGVKKKGCSGLQYSLDYVKEKQKLDEEVVQDGARVLIESKALFTILGSEMDFVTDKLRSQFVFHNPNVKESCGCGESFMV